jgi:hypothetical protein
LRAYVLTAADPDAAQRLDDDTIFFNATFDRLRGLRPPPAQPPTQPAETKKIIDKILARRETLVQAGRAERAGTVTGGSEAFGGGHQERGRDAEITRLKLAIRRNPNDTNLAAQLAKFYLNGDD